MKVILKFKDTPRRKTVHVWKNTRVKAICDLITEDNEEKLLVQFNGNKLAQNKSLDSVKVRSGAVLVVVRKCRPRVLPYMTQTSEEPCMITLDDSKKHPRARMTCGHAITPEGLFMYLHTELDAGKTEIRCPYTVETCDKVWTFNEIQEKACLTTWENGEATRKLKNNLINFEKMREENFNGDTYTLKLLNKCPKKLLYGSRGRLQCPSRRACPRCGVFIDHTAGCPRMTCGVKACGYSFCFICLKDTCDRNNCYVAPLQRIQAKKQKSKIKKQCKTKKIGIRRSM